MTSLMQFHMMFGNERFFTLVAAERFQSQMFVQVILQLSDALTYNIANATPKILCKMKAPIIINNLGKFSFQKSKTCYNKRARFESRAILAFMIR